MSTIEAQPQIWKKDQEAFLENTFQQQSDVLNWARETRNRPFAETFLGQPLESLPQISQASYAVLMLALRKQGYTQELPERATYREFLTATDPTLEELSQEQLSPLDQSIITLATRIFNTQRDENSQIKDTVDVIMATREELAHYADMFDRITTLYHITNLVRGENPFDHPVWQRVMDMRRDALQEIAKRGDIDDGEYKTLQEDADPRPESLYLLAVLLYYQQQLLGDAPIAPANPQTFTERNAQLVQLIAPYFQQLEYTFNHTDAQMNLGDQSYQYILDAVYFAQTATGIADSQENENLSEVLKAVQDDLDLTQAARFDQLSQPAATTQPTGQHSIKPLPGQDRSPSLGTKYTPSLLDLAPATSTYATTFNGHSAERTITVELVPLEKARLLAHEVAQGRRDSTTEHPTTNEFDRQLYQETIQVRDSLGLTTYNNFSSAQILAFVGITHSLEITSLENAREALDHARELVQANADSDFKRDLAASWLIRPGQVPPPTWRKAEVVTQSLEDGLRGLDSDLKKRALEIEEEEKKRKTYTDYLASRALVIDGSPANSITAAARVGRANLDDLPLSLKLMLFRRYWRNEQELNRAAEQERQRLFWAGELPSQKRRRQKPTQSLMKRLEEGMFGVPFPQTTQVIPPEAASAQPAKFLPTPRSVKQQLAALREQS